MIREKDEIIKAVADFIGEVDTDEAIALLEDVTDTLEDLTVRIAESGDWKAKYNELDSDWRKKYKERFLSAAPNEEDEEEEDEEDVIITNYEELFEEE